MYKRQIQRFGRVNRKRSKDTIGKYKPVHIIAPHDKVLPYKMDVLKRSFEQLPDDGTILNEQNLQEKIDNVYPCLLYTSDAADDLLCVDLGGRRMIKKKTKKKTTTKERVQ